MQQTFFEGAIAIFLVLVLAFPFILQIHRMRVRAAISWHIDGTPACPSRHLAPTNIQSFLEMLNKSRRELRP
jgi:hypothetical protein